MYRTFPLVVLLSLSFLLVMSCRKRSTSYDESDELVRFNAYRQVNYPSSKQLSEYAFMEKLKDNPAGETLKEGTWLYFDYWALNLDGAYLGSNIAERARLYNQFSAAAYYAPSYREINADRFGGEVFEAINGAHVGDEILIGLTATKAKALGLWKNPNYYSALFYIIPRGVVTDPEKHEADLIADFMTKNPGFEKHDSVYRKIEEVGTGNVIEKASKIWVQYEVYSLSGHLFDTNIQDVAQRHGIYSSSGNYNLLSYTASDDAKLIRGFSGLTVGLKTGTRLRALIPSALGYKKKGNGSIRPYEPLVVSMTIVRSSKK